MDLYHLGSQEEGEKEGEGIITPQARCLLLLSVKRDDSFHQGEWRDAFRGGGKIKDIHPSYPPNASIRQKISAIAAFFPGRNESGVGGPESHLKIKSFSRSSPSLLMINDFKLFKKSSFCSLFSCGVRVLSLGEVSPLFIPSHLKFRWSVCERDPLPTSFCP